jgi:hypothetical protein
VLTADGAGGSAFEAAAGGGLFNAYALLREQQAAGTDGGGATSGSWQTRVLNTEAADPEGIVTLAANQFALAAGTYYFYARAPAHQCNSHQAKLRNITAGADALIGTPVNSPTTNGTISDAIVQGRVTFAVTTTLELQHQVETTKATNGFGVNANFGVTEVYSEVLIWRETP